MNVTIIGFGEAGPVFGTQLFRDGMNVTAWDKLQGDPTTAKTQLAKTRSLQITPGRSLQDAVSSADLVISTVTASQALNAAEQAVGGLRSGSHWLDLNSVSPDTVPSKGVQVPILLCGEESQALSVTLNRAGFNTRSVSQVLGAASTTKLLRSILIKGMESLFAESMEAAGKVGVEGEVLDSLQATYPGIDWHTVAGYQLSRATLHAARRAAEMREAQALVQQLGVEPVMAAAIAERQQSLSDRDIASNYKPGAEPSVADYIDAVGKSGQT